jgi:DNA polymerase-3 subunit delta
MVAKKAHEVRQFIENGPPDGIYLVYGPDAGLVAETGRLLSRRLAGTQAGASDIIVLEGSQLDSDPSLVGVEARMTSLFGGKRVVRVRGTVRGLAPVLADLADDAGAAPVVVETGDLKRNDALRTFIEGNGRAWALPCYPDNDVQVKEVVAETLSKAGISADVAAISAIVDHLGNDREITRRELEKIVLFAAETHSLTRADVLLLLADSGALAIDEIIDATALGHAAQLDAAFQRAEAGGVSEQQILILALSHFRLLRRMRLELDGGASLGALTARVHFSRKNAIASQLRIWRDRDLQIALDRLSLGIAEARKSSGLKPIIAKRALLAVCMMAAER